MLVLSGFTITFHKSSDYQRFALLIHVFAAIVLLQSSLPWILILLGIFIIMGMMLAINRDPLPSPAYQKLSYHSGDWHLYDKAGHQEKYEMLKIQFNGGLFIWLTLRSLHKRKNLIIFRDQITSAQYRVLALVTKIK